MHKYMIRPLEVEAEQFDPDKKPWPDGVSDVGGDHWFSPVHVGPKYSFTDVLGGYAARLEPGDWIVTSAFGKCVVKKHLFTSLYVECRPVVPVMYSNPYPDSDGTVVIQHSFEARMDDPSLCAFCGSPAEYAVHIGH